VGEIGGEASGTVVVLPEGRVWRDAIPYRDPGMLPSHSVIPDGIGEEGPDPSEEVRHDHRHPPAQRAQVPDPKALTDRSCDPSRPLGCSPSRRAGSTTLRALASCPASESGGTSASPASCSRSGCKTNSEQPPGPATATAGLYAKAASVAASRTDGRRTASFGTKFRDKVCQRSQIKKNSAICEAFLKRMMGLEPTTFCMASRRSSQLSYIRASRPSERPDQAQPASLHATRGSCRRRCAARSWRSGPGARAL
jgi:hypothetical protein